MKKIQIKKDCRFFKGDMPCLYHKNKGVHCWDCKFYKPIDKKILIIKLGAAGDVIRTTPLLHKIKQLYPNAELTWITHFPELVPKIVDNILNFEFKNVLYLINTPFDIACNLDKDKEACALINMIRAKNKKGFKLENGKVAPINKDVEYKWITGLLDDANKKNRKSYIQEIFEIFGVKFEDEKYILDKQPKREWSISREGPLIGLNTGCGDRWKARRWPERHWVELAKLLRKASYNVILLGGKNEDRKNKIIARKANVNYLGFFSIKDFISLLDKCDLIVTTVTMALHIAISLEKKIILFNNVFNRYEFDLYNLGEIIEPNVLCLGCFKSDCSEPCIEKIDPRKVFEVCNKLLGKPI